MPLLLKFQMDYADEFDVYGFEVVTEERWNEYQEMFKCLPYPDEYYFGTNECLTIENEAEILRAIKVVEITVDQAEILRQMFGENYSKQIEFGYTPFGPMQETIPEEDYYRIFGRDEDDQ